MLKTYSDGSFIDIEVRITVGLYARQKVGGVAARSLNAFHLPAEKRRTVIVRNADASGGNGRREAKYISNGFITAPKMFGVRLPGVSIAVEAGAREGITVVVFVANDEVQVHYGARFFVSRLGGSFQTYGKLDRDVPI